MFGGHLQYHSLSHLCENVGTSSTRVNQEDVREIPALDTFISELSRNGGTGTFTGGKTVIAIVNASRVNGGEEYTAKILYAVTSDYVEPPLADLDGNTNNPKRIQELVRYLIDKIHLRKNPPNTPPSS